MPKTRKAERSLLDALTSVLQSALIEYEVETQSDSSTVVIFAASAQPSLKISALVLDERHVVLYLEPDFAIPLSHIESALRWAIDTNGTLFTGVVDIDPEDGEIRFRHSIDCAAVPDDALQAHFAGGLELISTLWLTVASTLLPVLAGEPDEDSEDDGEASALVHVDGEAESDDVAELIEGIIQEVLSDGFGEDVTDGLSGAIGNLAETYAEWVADANAGEVDIAGRVVGSDEGAVLTLSADGVSPLRFRFSPNAVRERFAHDAEGLTLLHYTTPDDAARITNEGFQDGTLQVSTGYSMNSDGIPIDRWAVEETDGVLLTDVPLAPDDRPGRTVLLTIAWGEDAPQLGEYERAETAYSGREAWLLERDVRRWHVPAKVLNEAIRDGLAEIQAA